MEIDPYEQRLRIGEVMFKDLLRQLDSMGMGLDYAGEDEDGDPCMMVVVYEDMPGVQ